MRSSLATFHAHNHLQTDPANSTSDLTAQATHLRSKTTHHHHTLRQQTQRLHIAEAQIATLAAQNEDLNAETHAAQQHRATALRQFEPVSSRLEGLCALGREVHDVLIRRVLRLEELEAKWEEARFSGGGGGLHHGNDRRIGGAGSDERNEELLREIGDCTYLLVQGWRKLEPRYVLETGNGRFGHWSEGVREGKGEGEGEGEDKPRRDDGVSELDDEQDGGETPEDAEESVEPVRREGTEEGEVLRDGVAGVDGLPGEGL